MKKITLKFMILISQSLGLLLLIHLSKKLPEHIKFLDTRINFVVGELKRFEWDLMNE